MENKRMELNIFFEAVDSINGYQRHLLSEIDEAVHFERCVCTVKGAGEDEGYGEKYTTIDYDICEHNRYDEICDLNELIPLDRDILEKMQPYESLAMKMLVRNMERDVYTYEECKELYLRHLRFWNHIFVTNNINYVVQVCVPHHCHDYVIYALAKIHKCGIMVNVATSIWNHWIPVSDLENCNHEIVKSYEQTRRQESVQLSDFVEHYYQSLLIDSNKTDQNLLYAGIDRKKHINNQKRVYREYFSLKRRWKRKKHLVKCMIINPNGECNSRRGYFDALRNDYFLNKRGRIKQHQMKSIKYYESKAVVPSFDRKYVIYYLQYQPEATTLPMAGVFVEQELVIALLADALNKLGIELWVKEHFVQPYRSKNFYDALASIPNVTLIKSTVDSKILMQHSIATATCNGTIVQESIFNNKSVLIFGYGLFNGAPGTYPCRNEQDIVQAIDDISQKEISQHDVRAFLKAFEQHAVHTNIYLSNRNRKCDISAEESRENIRKAVIERIQKYCKDNGEQ